MGQTGTVEKGAWDVSSGDVAVDVFGYYYEKDKRRAPAWLQFGACAFALTVVYFRFQIM